MIGFLTFMALEAVAMMYANVLRDHAYGEFDALFTAEVAFFVTRAAINVSVFLFKKAQENVNNFIQSNQALAMWSVMKFYHQIRSGITFKHNKENIIEL
jgi:hypothetical protein